MKRIEKLVVVGGGTAGWLTAGRIAAYHQVKRNPDLEVILVESPDVPIVGVGEGTWPTMRSTLAALGISETEFIRECQATFKQGAKFAGWKTGRPEDFYYHPLVLPVGFGKSDLTPYWQSTGKDFSSSVCFQQSLCEQHRAPKTLQTPEFEGIANYAYHLDAGNFARLLQKHCVERLGVKHLYANVLDVEFNAAGFINGLVIDGGRQLSGDLFVDCTGSKALLIGKHLNSKQTSCSDVLFGDRATVIQVPYSDGQTEIASQTIGSALPAGWVWDIGLQNRRGVGYVWSSQYTSEEQAVNQFDQYLAQQGDDYSLSSVRTLKLANSYRKTPWVKNCIAVGLSAGFIEPLEASSLVMVELAATFIAEQLPVTFDQIPSTAQRFNDTSAYRWARIIDFLKLHYCLSQRADSAFWLDHQIKSTWPDSLKELLELWQYRAPANLDFTSNNEVFPAASYQYVLYGMGFHTEFSWRSRQDSLRIEAEQYLNHNQQLVRQALARLPGNRELINKVLAHGFGRI